MQHNISIPAQIPFWSVLFYATLSLAAAAAEDEFQVEVKVQSGHLGRVFFGCAVDATKKYDRGKDVMAPPPGRGTGYTVFFVREHELRLYKDIRSPEERNTWQFYAQVYKDKPVRLTWKPESLPSGRNFYIEKTESGKNKKKRLDMRETTSIRLLETSTLTFSAVKKSADTTDPKPGAPTDTKEAGK